MKKAISCSIYSFLLLFLIFYTDAVSAQNPVAKGWEAGVAREVITPTEPVWLAGYASRTHVSEGTLTELWAKVLALADENGKKVVLITTDLIGMPLKMSERIRNRIAVKYGLTRSQIILCSSHTHTGPVLSEALFDIYPLDAKQLEVIARYSDHLEKTLVELTGKAISSMKPAQLFSQNGITRFQVNRRNNTEASLNSQTSLNGPNDYAVPVLKVTDVSGNIVALAFGYACHATVLDTYRFSGDYPGFAQMELERLHPGVTAMFFQGAGADLNPLPRRTVPLALQYGMELAASVERVLNEDMKKLDPVINTAYKEIKLTFSPPPTADELRRIGTESEEAYKKKWAVRQLKILEDNGSLLTSYPYPVVIWKLGDQPVIAIGGEPVVQYSLDFKRLYGPGIFVIGYANDVMSYIPSETVLKEGGYEGELSQMVYGLPSVWSPDIENKIIGGIKSLAVKAGLKELAK